MLVSVVVPCFNHGEFLDETVNSALAQTHQDLEVIVVDDGSTDEKTRRLVETYQKPRTQVICADHQGPSGARNIGIEKAKGDFILPLDADDKIDKTYVEKALKVLQERPEVGIVYCKMRFFGAKNEEYELPDYNFPEILLYNFMLGNAMFRKSDWQEVGGYNLNMVDGWEDYDFWLSLIERGRQVYRLPETLFFYRKHAVSRADSMGTKERTRAYLTLLKNHPKLYADNAEFIIEKLVEQRSSLKTMHSDLGKAQHELNIARAQLDYAQGESRERTSEIAELKQKVERLNSEILSLRSSRSWKLTAPLRRLSGGT